MLSKRISTRCNQSTNMEPNMQLRMVKWIVGSGMQSLRLKIKEEVPKEPLVTMNWKPWMWIEREQLDWYSKFHRELIKVVQRFPPIQQR